MASKIWLVKFRQPAFDAILYVIKAPAAKSLPAGDHSWTKVSLLNSPGSNTYPVASISASTQLFILV